MQVPPGEGFYLGVYFMQVLAQATIDTLAWFLQPFAYVLVISWAISLFRRD